MSETLISATQVANVLTLIVSILFLTGAVTAFIWLIFEVIYSKKIKKIKNEIVNGEVKFMSKREELAQEYDLKKYSYEEYASKRDKLNDEQKKENKEKVERYDKVDKKKESISNNFAFIESVVWLVMIIFAFIFLIQVYSIEPSVSSIHEAEDTSSQDVLVTAYYVISYDGVDQETLTIFVRNNNEKVLKSAVIKEKTTGCSEEIKLLAPGQEKIVTIDTNSKIDQDQEYEFEVESLEFMD